MNKDKLRKELADLLKHNANAGIKHVFESATACSDGGLVLSKEFVERTYDFLHRPDGTDTSVLCGLHLMIADEALALIAKHMEDKDEGIKNG